MGHHTVGVQHRPVVLFAVATAPWQSADDGISDLEVDPARSGDWTNGRRHGVALWWGSEVAFIAQRVAADLKAKARSQ